MKIKTLLLTTTLLASSVAFADAPARVAKKPNNDMFKDFYAKVEAGLTMPSQVKRKGADDKEFKNKFNKGFVGGIGGGVKFNEFFRSDLMFHYRNFESKKFKAVAKKGNDATEGKLKLATYSAMLNGYLDAHNDTIFTPYVMAGIGVGHIKPEGKGEFYKDNKAKAKTNFIWNAGLGCQAKVYENISADLGYRYVNLGKLKGMKKNTISTHEVLVGLIYNL